MTKAAVLTQYNQPLELWDIEWAPLKYGQVRVKMISSGICGAQLQEIRGDKGNHLPRLIGHEGVATVLEIGEGVTTVAVGDQCILHWRKGDGIESASPEWMHVFDPMEAVHVIPRTAGQITTFSEETVVSENRVTKAYGDLDLCCLLGCSLSTALGTLEQEAKLKMGESLLIIGAGGLGSSLYYASQYFNPSRVTICDKHQKHLTHFKNSDVLWGDWAGLLGLYSTYDVVIDTTGDCGALEAAVERLNPSGRLIMVGQPRGAFTVKGGHRLFSGEGITIKATQGGGFQPQFDIPRYLAANLDVSGIITHRISLSEINEGIELVKRGEAGRVIINFI